MMLFDVSLNATMTCQVGDKVSAIKLLRRALGTDLKGAKFLLDDLMAADDDGVRVRLSADQYAVLRIHLDHNDSMVWMYAEEPVQAPPKRDFSANGVRS